MIAWRVASAQPCDKPPCCRPLPMDGVVRPVLAVATQAQSNRSTNCDDCDALLSCDALHEPSEPPTIPHPKASLEASLGDRIAASVEHVLPHGPVAWTVYAHPVIQTQLDRLFGTALALRCKRQRGPWVWTVLSSGSAEISADSLHGPIHGLEQIAVNGNDRARRIAAAQRRHCADRRASGPAQDEV